MKKYSLLLVLFLLAGECLDPCKDVTCINGTCISGECHCDQGYSGEFCQTDDCDAITCDHGDCLGGVCTCDEGWGGDECDECDKDCGAHGDCDDDGDCVCTDGYTGDLCDTPPTSGYCTNTCGPSMAGGWANDGACDDGGPGSSFSVCPCGTDCGDCGTRSDADCSSATDAAISVWFDATDGGMPCNTQRIDVEINGIYEGFLDSYFTQSTAPDCGDAGTVTVDVIGGTHTVYAECNDGDVAWGPADFSVSSGNCLIISLGPDKSINFIEVQPKQLMRKR